MATGWGNKTWGASEWGDLSDETVSVSGISSTTSIGTSTTQANADVDVTGSQLTFTNAGAVAGASANVSLTGIQATFSIGEEDVARGIQQDVTGSQLTTTPGAVTIDEQFLIGAGWGRDTYGNLGWGVNYSVIPAEGTGIELTASIGDETAFTDIEVTVTAPDALQITYASPSFSIQIDQDIFVLASEDQLDGFVGSLTFQGDANVSVTGTQATLSQGTAEAGLLLEVPVTGIQLTSTIGTIALEQSTNEPVTGQELTLSLGTAEEIPEQIVGVSGIELTSSIGSVTVVGTSVVQPTGISATISAGQVAVTSWREINPGVTNVWTEVDLAA
jgi:hypothetical protein